MSPEEQAKLEQLGRAVIETETAAVQALLPRINAAFAQACGHMLACQGRVVVIGMGKSGHIGGKIAATLASTGTPAFFVHPGEASHGDLGMITPADVVLALSNSGETDEILTILPLIKRLAVPLIALTGKPESSLARAASVHLNVGVEKEACPLGLAPTASTTAALVMGDALAVALLEARGFGSDDFARSHPAGQLGRRLLVKVRDLMHHGEQIPRVPETASLTEALLEMTRKTLGMTVITGARDEIRGVFTDGDLRRVLGEGLDVRHTQIRQVMTQGGKSVHADALAVDALSIMQAQKISALIVVDDDQQLAGVLHMLDILRARVV